VENKTWEEAIEEILSPFELTYVLESRTVVLMRVADAQRRERAKEDMAAQIASLVSSESRPTKLHDAVIVFPLLDPEGRTTGLGTLLSEFGMLKATYIPKKVLNIHVPSVIEQYDELKFSAPGRQIDAKDRERVRARLSAKSFAEGTLRVEPDKSFEITLRFEGEHGGRDFSTAGTREDLDDMPQWIARCVHEYCGMTLSPDEQAFVNMPEFRENGSILKLVELEEEYRYGRRDPTRWRSLMRNNPDSVLTLYRYFVVSAELEENDFLRHAMAASRGLVNHDLVRFLEADWYHRERDYENSTPRFLELVKSDLRNEALYEPLDEGLLSLGLGKSADSLHKFWAAQEPGSHLPHLAQGTFFVNYAWDARGTGWASTVTEEGWARFRERLNVAKQSLSKAYEINPSDPRAATEMITVTRALSYDREQMEKWFKRAIDADPRCYDAYKRKLTYLMPKWGGSRDEMFAFARECAANSPPDSRVAMILMEAHKEMAKRTADGGGNWGDYYRNPAVWREMKGVYEIHLQENPGAILDRNYCALYACFAQDYEEAMRQFEYIGNDIMKECWGSQKYFYECRSRAYAEAK